MECNMSGQQLYNNYLPPFREAVRAGVGAVMSAFHDFNGVPCTMDRWLLTEVLRDEMGFDGFVVSDAEAVKQCAVHSAAADEKEAALLSLLAGGDMDMSSLDYIRYVPELVEEGRLDEAAVDAAVRRVMVKKLEYGLFDRSPELDKEEIRRTVLCEEHRRASYDAAAASAVLLKNDGVLPIRDKKRILVVGRLAADAEALMGPWSFTGRADALITIEDGMARYAPPGVEVSYAPGFGVDDDESGFAEALEKAKEADLVVAVAGETAFMSGEAASRADLRLAGAQERFLLLLAETGIPVVVVLVNGRPLSIGSIREHKGISAILESWHMGTECGHAVADLLYGRKNPCGRLTVTWANTAGQEPMYYNHPNTGKPGGDFKFTSKYSDAPIEPLYPFGYGLSYTTFSYSGFTLDRESYGRQDTVKCSVVVENTGNAAGEEVVQLYIRDLTASTVRPVRELKAFRKISLEPKEARRVDFELPVERLGFYDRDCRYVVEPGAFRIYVGHDSTGGLEKEFVVI